MDAMISLSSNARTDNMDIENLYELISMGQDY